MNVLHLSTGEGKTVVLIHESALTGYNIVGNVSEILIKAKGLGVVIPHPISYQDFIVKKYENDPDLKGWLIDDVDCLLYELTNHPISSISIMKTPEQL